MNYAAAKSLVEKLPPNLTAWQAAAMLRQPYARMRSLLLKHGYAAVDGRRIRWKLGPPKWRVPWGKINWRLSNIQIARKHRVSREIVRRMRNRFNMPFVEARGAKKGKPCRSKKVRAKKRSAPTYVN